VFVEINDVRLNVELVGPEGAPVLIAHHGGGGIGSLSEPKATFGQLADKLRVVVFDARGCGQSEAKPPFSHAQWAADMDGLREWVGADEVIVAGGSYGGFLAQEYAVAYPERTRAMILRDTSPDHSNLEVAFTWAREQSGASLDWGKFERYWSGQIRDDEDLRDCWEQMIPLYDYSYDGETHHGQFIGSGMYCRHEAHNWIYRYDQPNYDLTASLPNVTCPTLVTVGRGDWICPVPFSEKIAALIPGSKLVIFEHSGHSPQIEEPEHFQQVMRDFLTESGILA
jgi:proline iminopeptidase